MDLGQGSNVKLDRLTLGPDAEHWGVHRAADGSFERFSSVGNRDRFTRLLESKTDNIKSNNQIGFVSLGFNGDWAFSVNGHVEYRCGKPFQNELTGGWKVRKRVSTIVLSPMARMWIIVWDDGTLSHNLPFSIATEVEDYCQLQHSLKGNSNQGDSGQSKSQKSKAKRNKKQAGAATSAQIQQPTSTNSTQPLPTPLPPPPPVPRTVPISLPPPTSTALPVSNPSVTLTSTSSQQPATNPATKPAPAPLSTFPHAPKVTPVMKPTQPVQYPAQPTSQVPPQRTRSHLVTQTASQDVRRISRVETIPPKPKVYVPPKKMTTTLRVLDQFHWKDSYEYEKVVRLFDSGWKHQTKKRPRITRILAVMLPDHLNESYEAYKTRLEAKNDYHGANEQLVFHGTSRQCSLGEYEEYINLLSKAGSAVRLLTFKRFGPGIYTSTVSSKADDYASKSTYYENKAVLVAKVALGRESIYYKTTQDLTGPPYGYDSVRGEVGIDLNYDEQVLYKDDAIRPAYVVVYEKPIPVPQVSTFATTAPTTTTRPSATTTTRPRPAPTQNYTTYNSFQSTAPTTTRPTQTTTTNWFGQTTTTTTTNSSSSSGCIIM
ncbi:hypothetical protein FS837_008388 [Tulasnella sp. UAMH 9824]|nr:hypothetical protein FS837_008388 [Tulasnella sp. UAMH 9824]